MKGNVVNAVNESFLDIESFRESIYNGLLVQFRLGYFDNPDMLPWHQLNENNANTESQEQLSHEASQQSIVLLKNDNQS